MKKSNIRPGRLLLSHAQVYSSRFSRKDQQESPKSKDTGATQIACQLSIARSTVYKILEDEKVA